MFCSGDQIFQHSERCVQIGMRRSDDIGIIEMIYCPVSASLNEHIEFVAEPDGMRGEKRARRRTENRRAIGKNGGKTGGIGDGSQFAIERKGCRNRRSGQIAHGKRFDERSEGDLFIFVFFACIDVIAGREVAGNAFGPIVAHRHDEGGAGAVGGREEKRERGGFDRMIGDGFEGRRLGV